MKSKRVGKFHVQASAVENPEFPAVLSHMQFVPLRVEFLYHLGAFEYLGRSPLFPEVGVGQMVPEYDLQISTDPDSREVSVEVTQRAWC